MRESWVTKSFAVIRDAALIKIVNAYRSNLAKIKKKNYTIHFKKKKRGEIKWFMVNRTSYTSKRALFPTFCF